MKNCPHCGALGNLYFNPQITPVPSAGATGRAQITQICENSSKLVRAKRGSRSRAGLRVSLISGGRVLWGPSLDVIARKE